MILMSLTVWVKERAYKSPPPSQNEISHFAFNKILEFIDPVFKYLEVCPDSCTIIIQTNDVSDSGYRPPKSPGAWERSSQKKIKVAEKIEARKKK